MKNKIWITVLIVVGVLMLSVTVLSLNNSNSEISEELTKCIGQNSILYVARGCHYCHNQLQMFGEYVEHLNVIDCTKEPHKCLEPELRGIPTWFIHNETYRGVQSIKELKKLCNC